MPASDVRRWPKKAILVKIEDTYGTDAAPAVADGIVAANVEFTPMEGQELQRDLIMPYLGNQGVILTGLYARLVFDVEIAGSGDAGTAPKYDALLRACGFAQTITADTSVEYEIVEDAVESASIYFMLDGVQHAMLGVQANVAPTFDITAVPRFRFTCVGLLGTISDLANMPAVTKAGWLKPVPVTKANSVMTLHGWTATGDSLSLDLGNQLTPRFPFGDEYILISDRSASGTAVVEARSLATINWFEIAKAGTLGALSFVHGTTEGNIVEITAPAVEIGRPTYGQTSNVTTYSLPLAFTPDAGLDDFKITVR
ncbi:hypothetical protein JET14_11930 [Martelella lutilitoris]|uniref:Uncharacterized protein n=1 Tax=Martelella lutilitoris TaxID=2583532 RepID=A0A7T7HH18_9HYPH|nr:phage tail tube protein [Martelella lutilitoris]QQM29049.1 hypothetical protein JET14_11930 [Martelella lutilitoris]